MERRLKLWWSLKRDGDGDVGVMMKEELCEKVLEVRRMSDRIMAVVFVFEEDVLRLTCVYVLKNGRRKNYIL